MATLIQVPGPPAARDLAEIEPDIKCLAAGTVLWRVYFHGNGHSTRWNTFRPVGPAASRFDHHWPSAHMHQRQIFYAADLGMTALAEAFRKTRVMDRCACDPWLVAFALERRLKLLDLTGSWPERAGGNQAINHGPHPPARQWSQAIYQAYPEVEGLWYCAPSQPEQMAVALYERAQPALPRQPLFHRALRDPVLLDILKQAAAELDYLLF